MDFLVVGILYDKDKGRLVLAPDQARRGTKQAVEILEVVPSIVGGRGFGRCWCNTFKKVEEVGPHLGSATVHRCEQWRSQSLLPRSCRSSAGHQAEDSEFG